MSDNPYDTLATKLAREVHQIAGKYLAEVEGSSEADLWTLARRVVFERYTDDEAFDAAMTALERHVGRPKTRGDI